MTDKEQFENYVLFKQANGVILLFVVYKARCPVPLSIYLPRRSEARKLDADQPKPFCCFLILLRHNQSLNRREREKYFLLNLFCCC